MSYLLGLMLIMHFQTYAQNITSHKERIYKVLEGSIFNGNTPPESLGNGEITTYDPMMLSIVSSMYSRQPVREDSRYEQVLLPPGPHSEVCPYAMKAFVKHSTTYSPYTFVILPGAYATWKRGSFNNQTIDVLNKQFNDPNIVSFSGYLSPAFLEETCSKIPWDTASIARDMYARLSIYLKEIHTNFPSTGIIGYSGGGGLAALMLAEDAMAVQEGLQRIFGLGGAAFSPTLHGRTIFNNLDNSVRNIHHNRSLIPGLPTSGPEIGHLLSLTGLAISGFSLDWTDIVNLYESDPKDFLERSRNEFTESDLRGTLAAVGFDENMVNGHLSYYNAYINTGFARDMYPSVSNGTIDARTSQTLGILYDNVTDIRPLLDKIDRQFVIAFSQDDPVLSSWDDSGQPQVITEILEQAETNPHILVFNPRYGAHIGYFLDPIFEELIGTIFLE